MEVMCLAPQNAHQVLSSKGIRHNPEFLELMPDTLLAVVQNACFCLG